MEQRPPVVSSAPEPSRGLRPPERSERELSYMAELAHALATAPDQAEVLKLIADRLRMLLGSEVAAVVAQSLDTGELVVEAAEPAAAAVRVSGRRFERDGTLVDRALREARPIVVRAAGPAAVDPVLQELMDGRVADAGVVIPVRGAAGEELGAIVVLNPKAQPAPADIRFLLALADHAAVAMQRTRAERLNAHDGIRLRVMGMVLHAIGAGLDEGSVLRGAMDALLGGLAVDAAEVVLRDGGELRTLFQYPGADGGFPLRAARARALHLRTVERGKVTVTGPGDPAPAGAEPEPGVACCPLQARERTIGSLLVARRHAAFSAQERELLEAVGQYMGIAIELCRLFRRAAVEADQLERIAAERYSALEATQEQLERSQWLASLGEIAAGVAHDLNNALNPIVAFAELIKEHSGQPDRVRTYADRILMAAQGGAETVRRIQRFTRHRLGTMSFQSVQVATLVQDAVELVQPVLAERRDRIEVVQAVDPALHVNGSPGELRQALLNLITNAIDAMPNGGTLRFVARSDDERVLIAVQDTGTGMPPAIVERALEPFFTTKGAHGTGLGLPEVFGIVRRHGGTLEVETWPGVGTTVLLALPKGSTLPESGTARRISGAPRRRRFRILLIDDNLLGLEATAASLRAAGHRVITAANAESALGLFKAGAYDVVLSDLGLPDMTGWELLERIRSRDPKVRIGVITGWEVPDDDDELTRRGIEMVLAKPVDPDQLLSLL
ncbi:MAG TPA: ATP-binding protein [Longimicrobiales bacterium]